MVSLSEVKRRQVIVHLSSFLFNVCDRLCLHVFTTLTVCLGLENRSFDEYDVMYFHIKR